MKGRKENKFPVTAKSFQRERELDLAVTIKSKYNTLERQYNTNACTKGGRFKARNTA